MTLGKRQSLWNLLSNSSVYLSHGKTPGCSINSQRIHLKNCYNESVNQACGSAKFSELITTYLLDEKHCDQSKLLIVLTREDKNEAVTNTNDFFAVCHMTKTRKMFVTMMEGAIHHDSQLNLKIYNET